MKIKRFKEYAASSMGEERVNGLTRQEVESLERTFERDCKGIDWADSHPNTHTIEKILDIIYEHIVEPELDKGDIIAKESLYDIAFEYGNGGKEYIMNILKKSLDETL